MAMSYPKERQSTLRTHLFKFYKYRIFPKISNIRGAHRFKEILKKVALIEISKSSKSDSIENREWENLVILDAARYDTYRETINHDTDYRFTRESYSKGFIRENFSTGDWKDVVVITANPHYNAKTFKELTGRSLEDTFETVFQSWQTDWDDEKGTVLPEVMVKQAFTAQKLFPDKRKIIHFMQPHHPFLNSNIDDPGFGDTRRDNIEYKKVWERVSRNEVSHEKVLEGYIENHKLLKPYIEELKNLKGKTVATADHGNFLGENGFYGHPAALRHKALTKVPWDVLSEN